MDLTLQQLRAVVAVHDAGGFTAAADALLLAQSSLSRTVAETERRVGAALFVRTTRRLKTTSAGVEFVAAARRVLGELDTEMARFRDHLDGVRGHVRIATLPSLAALLLPGVVAGFRAARPEVEITISDALAGEVVERVRDGRADLAVTVVSAGSAGADLLDDLTVRPVADDRFCALVDPDGPLATYRTLAWRTLAREPFVDFDANSSIRRHVDHAFAAADGRPPRHLEARNIAAVAGLVAAGLGVTAVPGLVVPLTGFAGLTAVPLAEPVVRRRIALVHGPRFSPHAAAFADELTGVRERPALPAHARWWPLASGS